MARACFRQVPLVLLFSVLTVASDAQPLRSSTGFPAAVAEPAVQQQYETIPRLCAEDQCRDLINGPKEEGLTVLVATGLIDRNPGFYGHQEQSTG